MSVFRGVVNMFLVSVKVQCVNMRVFVKSTKAVYTITRITFAHNSKNSEFALQCFFEGQDCIPQNYEFGLDRTMTCEKQGFCCMRKCVCSECIKHMCRFLHFPWIANTRRPQWSEGHRHFRQTKPLDVYRHWWSTMLLPLQVFVRHCLWNSRENWNTSVFCNNRSNLIKCETWAIRLYEMISPMGGYFDNCWGLIGTCQLPWIWWFCCIRWWS